MRELDLEAWERREHFEFFRGFDQPFFTVTVELDVTEAVRRSRQAGGVRFFIRCLHAALGSANGVAELRYRIRGDRVVVHDVIHAGSTVLKENDTFSFGYFDYDPELGRFAELAEAELARVRPADFPLRPRPERDDLLHCTVLPWIRFTSFDHARDSRAEGSVPKLVFGRRFADGERYRMPVSIAVHHALADALHVGRFLDGLQDRLER